MADVTAKVCTSCHKILPLDAFHINKAGKYGRESKCKECKLSLQAIHRSKPEVRARIRVKDAERWKINAPYRERELARRQTSEVKERQRKASAKYKAKPGIRGVLNKKTSERRKLPEVREQARQYESAYRKQPEVQQRIRQRDHEKRSTIMGNLTNRIKVRMRSSLYRGKEGRSWKELVPYSIEELKAHLESRFCEGMSWENRHLWHIDHKRPIASFHYTSPDDDEFKECWALSNLQPLWAFENQRKSAKIGGVS
jgi:Skp family chaperone for outer membrane proteins